MRRAGVFLSANVIQLSSVSNTVKPEKSKPVPLEKSVGKFQTSNHPICLDLSDVAKTHGFISYAVLNISELRGDHIFPRMSFHGLEENLAQQIAAVEDLTNCSVFLMLRETNVPFPFTTGLDCRTNKAPDPSLLDNQLDALLNSYGIKGGYCVPVSTPNASRSVVMYFGPREETYSRYPSLVIDTIESFDAIWHSRRFETAENLFGLRPLELDCLKGLSEGKSYGEIGVAFSLSEHTIKAYLKSCVAKTSAKSIYEALIKTKSAGLI